MDATPDPLASLEPEATAAVERALDRAAIRGRATARLTDLLAAILGSYDSSAKTLLQLSGVSERAIVDALDAVSDVAGPPVAAARLGPDVMEALDIARREAVVLGHEGVWSVHLLLAILQGSPGVARAVLESAGLELEQGRNVARFLYDPSSATPIDFPQARAEPSVGSLGFATSSLDYVTEPDAETLAWGEQMRAQYERMHELYDPSGPDELVRVIGVGQTRAMPGGRVELLAIEIRTRRALLTWRARCSHSGLILGGPKFEITDEIGTSYTAFPSGSSGSEHELSGETFVVPIPPAAATLLTITIERFAADGPARPFFLRRSRPLEGPWVFEVPVG
jgi:hypothetical protein